MGLASFPCGIGPCGADPVAASSPSVIHAPTTTPSLPKFDIGSRAFVTNADGTLVQVHPVDQEVNLALGIEEGQIASAKTVGHRIRKIARAGGPDLVARVTDAVNIALSLPLTRKDIKILDVSVDATTVRGRIATAVTYLNLRTMKVQTATVK